MTTGEITAALLRDRWKRNFCLPRFTPSGWWEADVFELTDAGYWREYEIKVTRADFRQDQGKRAWRKPTGADRKGYHNKHDLLAARDTAGPSHFWFVCPAGLIGAEDVPEWAGLIHMTDCVRGPRKYRLRDVVVKPAPRLHKEKCRPQVAEKARECCYWRLHAAWGTEPGVHEPDDYVI